RLRTLRPHFSANSVVCETARTDWLGCRAIRYGGNRIDAYVDFSEPGGINTASRLILPRAMRSRPSINILWCAAGSNPQYRDHSMRLRRKERRLSNRSAANSNEISDVPESGPFMEGSIAKLGCAILFTCENVHQFFIADFIHVLFSFVRTNSSSTHLQFGFDPLDRVD